MRLAVISDIHSNIYAFQAVLEDIKDRNVDQILCAGDLVGYTPFPNEVIELVQKKEITTVQGNYDDAVGNEKVACGCDYDTATQEKIGASSLNFSILETTEENQEFLQKLPQEFAFELGAFSGLLVHGSPRRLNEYLYEGSEQVKEVLADIEVDILVCGHTHLPYHQLINGQHVINVGSVGKPKHGNPNGIYTIIEAKAGQIRTEFVEVPYPVEKVTAEIRQTELANEIIKLLKTGQS